MTPISHIAPAKNTASWDRLSITAPKHANAFSRSGGFKGTAITPMWAITRMTEEFGPVGIGWGWTEHQHVVETGMVFTQVSVWYLGAGETEKAWVGPQWGGTSLFTGKRDDIANGKGTPDDECFKKSTTDAILKCLSYIGVGADIHMGLFDDSKYVEQATTHHSHDAGHEDVDMKTVKGFLLQLGDCGSMDALKAKHETFKDSLAKIKARSPDAYAHYAAEMTKHKGRFEPTKAAAE